MRNRVILVALMLILGTTANSSADPGDTLWTRTYGGYGTDIANAAIQTSDGGYLLAGATSSSGNGGFDAYLVKTDPIGEIMWEYTYGTIYDEGLSSVQQTSEGGYVAAGFARPDSAFMDIYLLRVDSMGTMMFQTYYGVAGDDSATHVEITADNRFLVCGVSERYQRARDAYVIKIDPDGDGAWVHNSGGVMDDGAYCITPTSDGNYILAGFTSDAEGPDIFVEKMNSSGAPIWYQGYPEGIESRGYSILEDNGSYLIAGYAFNSESYLDAHLLKINASGGIVWSRNYGSDKWEVANCMAKTAEGGYILAGSKLLSIFPDTMQVYLVRVLPNGQPLWQSTIDLGTLSEAHSVAFTADSNYIVAGGCNPYGMMDYNCFLAKIQGETITSIDDHGENPISPKAFELGPVYPNPFNAKANISYSVLKNAYISIEIFNILGNRVACLFDGLCPAGNHSVIWDASTLSSGVYLVSLRTGGRIKSEKIVLMK